MWSYYIYPKYRDTFHEITPSYSYPGPRCSKCCQLNELIKGHFVNCFSGFNMQYSDILDSVYNILIFFAEKM